MNNLYNFFNKPLRAALLAVALAFAFAALYPAPEPQQVSMKFREYVLPSAQAATPNVPASGPGVLLVPLHLSGTYSTTPGINNVARFAMPQPCDMLGVGGMIRSSTGTAPTLTIDVLKAGVTILSAPFNVNHTTWSEGTISVSAIADESLMSVNLALDGTSPTFTDITVLMTCARK